MLISCQNKPSLCVQHVLRTRGIYFHGPPLTDYQPSYADKCTVSRIICAHSGIVEKVHLSWFPAWNLSENDGEDHLELLLSSLCSCTRLKELSLRNGDLNHRQATVLSTVITRNSSSLELVDVSHTWLEDRGQHQLVDSLQRCRRLRPSPSRWPCSGRYHPSATSVG